MLKKFLLPLMLFIICAFLFAACSTTDTNTTSNTTANANSNKAVTTTTTTSTSTSPANTNTASTNTATTNTATNTNTATTTTTSGEKIGVPECDEYIAKYEACISGKVPEAARAQYNSGLAQMRKSWKEMAANPQTKAALIQACKTASENAKQSFKSFGCDF